MIGVLAPASDHLVVSEFFELFKTPWEYLRSDRRYDVILCVGEVDLDRNDAKVVLHYSGCALPIDEEEGFDVTLCEKNEVMSCEGHSLAILGSHIRFNPAKSEYLATVDGQWSYCCRRNGVTVHRVGYDLFAEIARLLTIGQPSEFAESPTAELHVSLLRDKIVQSGIELIEIPPVPEGYACIACVTHDIDHPAIRNHKWDATAIGFLYRATAGSLANFLRGRLSFRSLLKNWGAAFQLPFAYAGVAKDFWAGFEDRYFECEKGIHSTYFVIPFRDRAGNDLNGPAPRRRAARYAAKDIQNVLCKIRAQGCEVGLHGIDAWRDSESARAELAEVRRLTKDDEIGVRMHWLFYSEKSPAVLEEAGASYDATIGYRDTVGFRTGTTQVYKPIAATRLLELPMHVMDTALFYPAYLGLTQQKAESRVRRMIALVVRFGGCLTLNWHDRSLASERNWDSCYRALLDDLKNNRAWFATASQATAWFQMRRSVVFDSDMAGSHGVRARITSSSTNQVPGLRLRTHKLKQSGRTGEKSVMLHVDAPLQIAMERYQVASL